MMKNKKIYILSITLCMFIIILLDATNFLTAINDQFKIHINSAIYIMLLSIIFPIGLTLYLFNKENKARQLDLFIAKLNTQGILDETLKVVECIRNKNIGFVIACVDGKLISKNELGFIKDELNSGYIDEEGKTHLYSAIEHIRRSTEIYDVLGEKYRGMMTNSPAEDWQYTLHNLISDVVDITVLEQESRGVMITAKNQYNIISSVKKHLEPEFFKCQPLARVIQRKIINASLNWNEKHPNLYAENFWINMKTSISKFSEFKEEEINKILPVFIKESILSKEYENEELERYCEFLIMQDEYLANCQKFLKTLKINILL